MKEIEYFSRNDEKHRQYKKPNTRVELFFSVIRERFIDMMVLNWIYLLFYIPLILWFTYFRTSLLMLLPCFAIIGIGNAGMAKVCMKWSRDEPVLKVLEFFDSIKKNWKQCMLIGLVTGFLPIIINWYVQMFLLYGVLKIAVFGAVISGFFIILWLISVDTMFVLSVGYDLPWRNVIGNGILMSLSHLLTSIGISILSILPVSLIFIIGAVVDLTLGVLLTTVYLLLLGFSLFWILKSSYANRLSEELINSRSGLPVRIGLADERLGNNN